MKLAVASPCKASWEGMNGDDRVRFCGLCQKKVFNLSGLTPEEIEALLRSSGRAPCVRFFERADGTVMTADCPLGRRRRWLRRQVGAAALLLTGLCALGVRGSNPSSAGAPEWFQQILNWLGAKPAPAVGVGQMLMGEPALPPSPPGTGSP